MANNSQFGLNIDAILNTSNVPKQMAELNAKLSKSTSTKIQIPITVNSKTGLQTLENFVKEVNVYTDKLKNKFQEVKIFDPKTGKLWENFDKITKVTEAAEGIKTLTTETHKFANTKGEIQTWTTSINNAGETIHTRSKQYIDDAGNMVKETSNWGRNAQGHWQKLGDTVKTATETIKDITTTTSNQVGKINDLNKEYNGLITTTEKVSSNGEYLKTVVSKYTNEMGQAVEKTEQFNKVGQQVATTMRKISDISKGNVETGTSTLIDASGNKTIYQYADGVATLRTEVNQYKTALGGLVTVTSTYNEQTGELISKNREVTTDLKQQAKETQKLAQYKKELVTTTLEEEKSITRNGKQYKAVVKTIEEETAEYGKLTTTITTYTDTLGRTVVETEKVNEKGEHVAQTTKTITKELDKASNSVNKYGQSTKQATQDTKTFGQQLGDAITRLARYYIASMPIQMVRKAISEAITTVKEFDSALIEFRKVSDLAGESLTRYVEKLAEMGEITGSTMQAMVEASTEFRKSGFSDEDSAKLASIAEKYRNIADEEISAGESASFIIAQMKAFNIEAEQAEHIIDAVNEVANNFSVSSADLAKNLGNMSAIMAINNVSMEEQIGMLTGVTEITRNASSASRGLVMISSRLTQVLDDTSSTGKKLTKIYNDLGIELKDENGQLRSHYDILGDLAKQWNNLSENQQKYIALTSAGARQQQNFVAMMQNWNKVSNATTTAYKSMGSAQKENEKVMDSIAKKVEILKSQFQQLVIGKGGLQDFAKTILDVGIALLKFSDSDVGKVVIATTALITSITLLEKKYKALQLSVAKYIAVQTGIPAEQVASLASTIGLAEAFEYLKIKIKETTIAFLSSPFGVASIAVAGLAALTIVLDKFIVNIEESKEKVNELSESVEQANTELQGLKGELESINNRIEELNNKEKLSIVEEHELKILQQQSKELERQVELQERELELAERKAERASIENINTKSMYKGIGLGHVEATQDVALDAAKKQYENLNKELKNLENEKLKLSKENKEETKEYEKLTKKINETQEAIDKTVEIGNELANTLSADSANLKSLNGDTSELKEKIDGVVDSWLNATDANEAFKQELKNRLKELSKGGNVDLTLRPVIDAELLNQAGYEAGEGVATVFTQTFTNKANDIAMNFTPIMVDPQTGEFLGVMKQSEFEQYCEDVVNGVREDNLNLQIGMGFKKEDYEDFIGAAEDAANEIHEIHEAQIELEGSSEEVSQSFEDETDDVEELEKRLNELAETLGITATELEVLREKFGDEQLDIFLENLAQAKQETSDYSTIIDNLQSSLEAASNALAEYNENGYLTLDTFQSLMGISAQYLAALVNEEGQLEINQTTLGNLIEVLKTAKIEELADAAAMEINALQTENAGNAANNAKPYIDSVGNAASEAGRKAAEGATGMAAFNVELNKMTGKSSYNAQEQAIINKYKNIAKDISSITVNTTAAGNAASKAGKKGAGAAKEAKDATKELNKELEETKSKYEKVISFITGRIDKQTKAVQKQKNAEVDAIEKIIKAREKQKDKELDAIEEQINALEKEKDAREKYWDDQIDALKKANDERKDALELQEKLDALEKAKNTKVKIYKEGQGFVYDVDQTAVAEAQQALDEYLSEKAYEDELARLEALKDAEVNNYDQRLDALNQYKDNVQKSYEDQIAALEAQREALEEQYDAQIEYYNNFKEQFEDMVKAYEDKQTELLASQLTGINFENNNWMTRLDNLAKFVNEYNRLQEQLNTGNKNNTNTAQLSGGGGSGGTTPSTKSSTPTMTVKQREVTPQEREYMARVRHVGKTYASGTPSVKDNEIAIVGENPNQEIVIGSKINNGELMSLEKGTGVVNADSSKTIAGLLNQVGQFGASGFGSGNGTLSNINNDSLTINGVTIQGANINDPQTFVNGLLNLKAEALQRAYRHR